MGNQYFYHLLRMVIASAICTGMIGFGLFARRGDRSRRWLFVAAGLLCSLMTAITVLNTEGFPREVNSTIGFMIAGFLLLPAIALIIGGWKGRRTGDHPYCRKCGFDLFGKPEESTRCGECGHDLALPKAVETGIRQVRRGWVLVGIFLLILGLMLGGESGREFARHVDLNQYKPTWWLLRDLDDPAHQYSAYAALQGELKSSNISQAHAQQIAEHVLKDQEAGKGSPLIFDLIELIDHRDLLDEKTTRRIIRQVGCLGHLITPNTLVRGRAVPFFNLLPAGRPGTSHMNFSINTLNLNCSIASAAYRVGELHVPDTAIRPPSLWSDRFDNWTQQAIDLADNWQQIPGGRTTLICDGTLLVTLNYRGKQVTETVPYTQRTSSRVATAEEAALRLIQPTEDDLKEIWSGTIFTGGLVPRIRIERTEGGQRIFAHAAILDSQGRHEIGIASVDYQMNGTVLPESPFQLPIGDFKIELVPAPLDGAGGWDDSGILNQTIMITAIKRSPTTMPAEE